MEMKMDEGEILREYKLAKQKNRQIEILADQNCCSKKDMALWLHEHGAAVDKRLIAKKPAPEPEPEAVYDPETYGLPFETPVLPNAKQSQTAKADAGKPRLTLVPMQIIFDIARIREYGCNKYPVGGKDNWKQVDIQRYRDAAFRHFVEYLEDPAGVDEESGLPHLAHLACNVAFLCELEAGK